jgi:N-carbamoyl-L-amino-acid hydrolase
MDMKTSPSALRIDGPRLWSALMELAAIGATPKGGVCRLALSELDKQGRDLVTRWAREAGMTVTIDKIGNGFMRRAGRNNSLPPIMTGSHIDTQPTACWRAWRWCARSTTTASRPKPPSRWPSGPTKKARVSCR